MKKPALGMVALALVVTAAVPVTRGQKTEDKDTPVVYKVSADEIAKEFNDDAAAAKKKYGATPLPEIQLTGITTLPIGSGANTELIVENTSKIPIRLGVGKQRPANFPAGFTATATFKGYFDLAKELSLTASKITYK